MSTEVLSKSSMACCGDRKRIATVTSFLTERCRVRESFDFAGAWVTAKQLESCGN